MEFAGYFRELTDGPVGEPIDRTFDFPPLPKMPLIGWFLRLDNSLLLVITGICIMLLLLLVFCYAVLRRKRRDGLRHSLYCKPRNSTQIESVVPFFVDRCISRAVCFLLSVLIICVILLSYSYRVKAVVRNFYESEVSHQMIYRPTVDEVFRRTVADHLIEYRSVSVDDICD